MSDRIIRIRRDALPPAVQDLLHFAKVGSRVRLTVYGEASDAVITELDPEWVQFETGLTSIAAGTETP